MGSFGTDLSITFELYNDPDFSTWRDFAAIHLHIKKRFMGILIRLSNTNGYNECN